MTITDIANKNGDPKDRRYVPSIQGPLGSDMHHRTYQRLCDAITELEMAADGLFVQEVMRRWPDLLVS